MSEIKFKLTKKEEIYLLNFSGRNKLDFPSYENIMDAFHWERSIYLSEQNVGKTQMQAFDGFFDLSLHEHLGFSIHVSFIITIEGTFHHYYESMGKGKLESKGWKQKETLTWEHQKDPRKPLKNEWKLTSEGQTSYSTRWDRLPRNFVKNIFGTDDEEELILIATLFQYKPTPPSPRKLNTDETTYLDKIKALFKNKQVQQAIELAEALNLLDNLAHEIIPPNLYKRKI